MEERPRVVYRIKWADPDMTSYYLAWLTGSIARDRKERYKQWEISRSTCTSLAGRLSKI